MSKLHFHSDPKLQTKPEEVIAQTALAEFLVALAGMRSCEDTRERLAARLELLMVPGVAINGKALDVGRQGCAALVRVEKKNSTLSALEAPTDSP